MNKERKILATVATIGLLFASAAIYCVSSKKTAILEAPTEETFEKMTVPDETNEKVDLEELMEKYIEQRRANQYDVTVTRDIGAINPETNEPLVHTMEFRKNAQGQFKRYSDLFGEITEMYLFMNTSGIYQIALNVVNDDGNMEWACTEMKEKEPAMTLLMSRQEKTLDDFLFESVQNKNILESNFYVHEDTEVFDETECYVMEYNITTEYITLIDHNSPLIPYDMDSPVKENAPVNIKVYFDIETLRCVGEKIDASQAVDFSKHFKRALQVKEDMEARILVNKQSLRDKDLKKYNESTKNILNPFKWMTEENIKAPFYHIQKVYFHKPYVYLPDGVRYNFKIVNRKGNKMAILEEYEYKQIANIPAKHGAVRVTSIYPMPVDPYKGVYRIMDGKHFLCYMTSVNQDDPNIQMQLDPKSIQSMKKTVKNNITEEWFSIKEILFDGEEQNLKERKQIGYVLQLRYKDGVGIQLLGYNKDAIQQARDGIVMDKVKLIQEAS